MQLGSDAVCATRDNQAYLDQLKVYIFALQICYSNDSFDTDLCHLTLVPANTAAKLK